MRDSTNKCPSINLRASPIFAWVVVAADLSRTTSVRCSRLVGEGKFEVRSGRGIRRRIRISYDLEWWSTFILFCSVWTSTSNCMCIIHFLFLLRVESYICVVDCWIIERKKVPFAFSVEVSKKEPSDELEHRLRGRCSRTRDLSLQLDWYRVLAMTALSTSSYLEVPGKYDWRQ